MSFTDGTKFEDILKAGIFLFTISFPTRLTNFSFTIVDLYLAFEEHTELTITVGQQEIRKFASLMEEYIKLSSTNAPTEGDDEPKNWNFPKMHALVHSFDDIEAKGASRNYNTKPNKKLHGPLKKSYTLRTNFKNFAG
ncbi:hypothetical protein EI94DRAFT_1813457 [Lactarius quietus]|nr:hypothetical protein EI94DRAFT_1813457 [Lactarius quietus]